MSEAKSLARVRYELVKKSTRTTSLRICNLARCVTSRLSSVGVDVYVYKAALTRYHGICDVISAHAKRCKRNKTSLVVTTSG